MKSILGISAFYHDSAASILIDGKEIKIVNIPKLSKIPWSTHPIWMCMVCVKSGFWGSP